MGAGNGRMWASAPTGVMKTRRPGNHTGPPLIPSRRGRRPRRPAFTAGAAPAERERRGIQEFPGLEDSPGASRLIGTSTRNGQPSPAGGMEVCACADRPAEAIFSLGPSTARSLFVKNKKRMGGGNAQPSSWLTFPVQRDGPRTGPRHASAFRGEKMRRPAFRPAASRFTVMPKIP